MENKELSYNIYLQARRFADSAELLFKIGNFDPNKYYIPAWVLAAFGLELYLKSILQFERGLIKRTHNIMDIFGELKDESKVKIRANFKTDLTLHPPHHLKEIEKQSGMEINDDFEITKKRK